MAATLCAIFMTQFYRNSRIVFKTLYINKTICVLGLTAIVSGFACNCNLCMVLFSTCGHFGNRVFISSPMPLGSQGELIG